MTICEHRVYRCFCHRFSPVFSDFDDRFAHTRIIREHYVFLVDHLDAKHSGLVDELCQAEVLSTEERESVKCELISFTQNEKLLSMLSRKTNDQFDKFLDALDNTGQQHVRNHVTGRQGQFLLLLFRIENHILAFMKKRILSALWPVLINIM